MKRLRLVPFLLVPAVVLGLAACSSSGSGDDPSASASASGSAACFSAGKQSDSVKVSGDFGGSTAPKVTFAKGLTASSPQRSNVITGHGKQLADGDFVKVAYSVYQSSSATKLGSVGFGTGEPQVLSVSDSGFGLALRCSHVGTRFALAGASKTLGFQTKGQIVVIADVVGTVPTRATGTSQPQDPALPTVKLAANGAPTITIPKTDPPTTVKTEVLKQGNGAAIASGDSALVQYTGEVYSTGKVFDSSWKRGEPATFTVATGSLISGFVTGLVGQKVGSQVLIVIPPAEGYGDNPQEGSGIPKGATLVFVVDILAKG